MSATDSPSELLAGVHPLVAHLSWAVGSWVGTGVGEYADSAPFNFEQEVVFESAGEPHLTYRSQAWRLDDQGNRTDVLLNEAGVWHGRENNYVFVEFTQVDGHALWLGKTNIAEIVDAVITRAGMKLYGATDAESDLVTPDIGVRSYGLMDGNLLIVHEMGPENDNATNKISIMMGRA